MASKKSNIEIILSARDVNMQAVITKGRAAIKAFTSEVGGSGSALSSMRTQVLQLVGALAGLAAIGEVGSMLKTADQNAYSLAASIKAANREFSVGTADEWSATVADLSQKMRIYSESDVKGATARTIDMTKRLGMNAEQMKRVIELSGDLAAGRTTLEQGVERVTAALRGEAESAEFLGLTLNENYVKAWYEASAAHEKAWKDLNDLEKAQVRYNVFLEQAIPLQGRAAESVNTWSGALAYVQATVSDSIGTNEELVEALKEVGVILQENAAGIGSFAAAIATGAGEIIKFVAANQEAIIAVLKYGAAFTVAYTVIGKLVATVRGLNAVMLALTGLNIVGWLRGVEAGSIAATAGVRGLQIGLVGLMGATAAFFAAYKVGEWLTMRSSLNDVAIAQGELQRATARTAAGFKEVTASTGVTIKSMDDLDRAVADGRIHYDQLTGTWKKGSAEQQAATQKTATVMKQATGEALAAMEKKYQEYAQKIRGLQEQIAGRERSLAAELRELSRTGMSDVSAWRDRKKEADQYAQAAKAAAATAQAAMAAGDTITGEAMFKEALQYADDAKQAYKSLNGEVKQGDQVIISQQQALKTAMEGVKRAGESGIEILKQQQQAAKSAMDGLIKDSGFVDLEKGMDASEKKWLENWKKMEDFATEQIATVSKRIDAMVEDRHVTVYVTEKVRQARADGGLIHKLAGGGMVPGWSPHKRADNIMAALTAREFVEPVDAVDHYGAWVFEKLRRKSVDRTALHNLLLGKLDIKGYAMGGIVNKLNNLRLPEIPRFALGGPVGMTAAAAAPVSGYSASFSFTDQSGQPGRVHGSEIDIRRLEAAINKHNRFRSSNR